MKRLRFRATLESLGFGSYREYLRSDRWQELRRRFFAESSRVANMRKRLGTLCCEFCGVTGRPLDLHHRTYKRLGREKLTDLVLLCRDCHRTVHKEPKDVSVWAATQKVSVISTGHKLGY
jgi:5-methylcytosine-specific restriction endonuclease McrA